jgi:spore coat protein CotF
MKNELNTFKKFANKLDDLQMFNEADIVTEAMTKIASDSEYDHEKGMVRNEMQTAKRAIEDIMNVVGNKGEGNLMAWVQSKITNAVQMLKNVADYMMSEKEMDEPKMATASDKNKGKKLNKPFRTPSGPKKFSVYVKNDKGNVVKVNFGDPGLSIKRDDPNRRKNFRARHNCDNPGPKTKARYWSCKNWEAGKSVTDILKGK